MEHMKIAGALIEYDAVVTREAYASDEGGINGCDCDCCVNYRLARDDIYPEQFRAMLLKLGIDYCKEVEVTHLHGDREDVAPYGHSVLGHYAFVGRILEPAQGHEAQDQSRFNYSISTSKQLHPVTQARFGKSANFIDLEFWVPHVPRARH